MTSQHFLKKAFKDYWEKENWKHSLFTEHIKNFRKKHKIKKAELIAVGLTFEELGKFQEKHISILKMWDLIGLVQVMNLLGISLYKLMRILNQEERSIRNDHMRKAGQRMKMCGTFSNRWINGRSPRGPIRPSLPEFISRLREELKKQGLKF